MANTIRSWLLLPWGFLAILAILILGEVRPEFVKNQASWLMVVFIVFVAILESLKSGYSVLRVMYVKLLWTMLSAFIIGVATVLWLSKCSVPIGQDYFTFDHAPWQVYMTIVVMWLIELVNMYVMLKAGMREWNLNDNDR